MQNPYVLYSILCICIFVVRKSVIFLMAQNFKEYQKPLNLVSSDVVSQILLYVWSWMCNEYSYRNQYYIKILQLHHYCLRHSPWIPNPVDLSEMHSYKIYILAICLLIKNFKPARICLLFKLTLILWLCSFSQSAFGAFAREGLTKNKKPVVRNFYSSDDVSLDSDDFKYICYRLLW